MYIFVYGTLKKGRSNHELIKDCEYVGQYFTDKKHTLIVAGLPFLVKRKGPGALGEVYKLDNDTLKAVDRLEGHPNFYQRQNITVTEIKTGETLEVQSYIHPDVFNEREFPWEYTITREF